MHLLLGDCQAKGLNFVLNNRTVKSELEKFRDKWVENYVLESWVGRPNHSVLVMSLIDSGWSE